jgi:hypothetical protein
MASNFRISTHRNSENLHLKLIGDFDGSSACQLLDVLKKTSNSVYKIIIHTSSLNAIYPFGRDTFHRNLRDLNAPSIRLLFTGENANQISPKTKLCL